ncbi:MAG: glutathione-disulfide reductase [Snowella sp.]|nr:glutathione-disulfide reductase [Snowella sp.]
MSYDFDLFVIGGGSGGIATARRAAEYGAKVGIAEADRLGGTCVNKGCVPKKLLVYASRFADHFHEAQGYGWSPIESHCDWKTLITAVNQEVNRLNGIYQRMLDNSKVEIFREFASFIDLHTLQVGDKNITADKILIAVGGHPVTPQVPGIEHALISDDMFNLTEQPKNLVVLGGGYIGVEFACLMNKLGSKVTQIIRGDKILRGFDEDLRTEIQESMIKHGINIINHSKLISIDKTDRGLNINLENICKDHEKFQVSGVDSLTLAALGRRAKLDNLNLDKAGVCVKHEAIAVNEYSQTSQPNIFAVGDCTNRINLTPVAINEGRALADTEFGGKSRIMAYDNVPSAVFSTPEAATVGLTECQAVHQFGEDNIKIYRSKFRSMYYTLPNLDEKTLMKLVVRKDTDQVIGAHMVGDYAAEIIQGVAIAVKMGATKADFDATVGIHPTSAEEFVTMR